MCLASAIQNQTMIADGLNGIKIGQCTPVTGEHGHALAKGKSPPSSRVTGMLVLLISVEPVLTGATHWVVLYATQCEPELRLSESKSAQRNAN